MNEHKYGPPDGPIWGPNGPPEESDPPHVNNNGMNEHKYGPPDGLDQIEVDDILDEYGKLQKIDEKRQEVIRRAFKELSLMHSFRARME